MKTFVEGVIVIKKDANKLYFVRQVTQCGLIFKF